MERRSYIWWGHNFRNTALKGGAQQQVPKFSANEKLKLAYIPSISLTQALQVSFPSFFLTPIMLLYLSLTGFKCL